MSVSLDRAILSDSHIRQAYHPIARLCNKTTRSFNDFASIFQVVKVSLGLVSVMSVVSVVSVVSVISVLSIVSLVPMVLVVKSVSLAATSSRSIRLGSRINLLSLASSPANSLSRSLSVTALNVSCRRTLQFYAPPPRPDHCCPPVLVIRILVRQELFEPPQTALWS